VTHLRVSSLAAVLTATALLSACAIAPAATTPPAAPPQWQPGASQPASPPLREYSYRQPEAPAAVPDDRPENRVVLTMPPPVTDALPPEPEDTVTESFTGLASWYGRRFHGRRTASGEKYDMAALTAAHKTLPFGSRVRVTNLDNGHSVVVVINDRGPFVKRRLIDVSRAAAQELGFVNHGVAKVRVDVLGEPSS
jgi:peptidoglycan lytic transglycosylase